ncbi:mannose-6-phosphate isomerase [Melampsora americana]|nr:mannose-6-phosphate isomerase [Melampsora americana]
MTSDSIVIELIPQAQSYDWGKLGKDGSKVAEYARHQPGFDYDESKPYAELWMGTHPSLPTRLAGDSQLLLADYIARDPKKLLGERVAAKYNGELPFLFKILAIRKALSIQAHPDKTLAERLHRERPEVYKDPNHKPEMAIALTAFAGFCGFRPLDEIAGFLRTTPEFAAVVGKQATESFLSATSKSTSQIDQKSDLRALFSALMNANAEHVSEELGKLVSRLTTEAQDGVLERLVIELDKQFPRDVGIFCAYMLNLVHLEPGQAAFLSANEPHAYLSGDIVECMATSDNVVRAGLTPKLRDVNTLVEMLTYKCGSASSQRLEPTTYKTCTHTVLYDPPIAEFSVLATTLGPNESDCHPPIDGPSIVIVTSGTGAIESASVEKEGQVYYLRPNEQVKLTSGSNGMICYRAFVEA